MAPLRPSLHSLLERILGSKLAVFLITAAVYGASTSGRLMQSPDAKLYLGLSEAIRNGRLEVFLTKAGAGWSVIAFPMLVALAQTMSPNHWQTIILIFNIICTAVTAVILVRAVRLVTPSLVAATAALLFYLAAYDVIIWVKYVLTDPLYGVFTSATFYLMLRGITGPPMKRRGLWLMLALLAGFITRPAGIVLVPIVIVTEWLIVREKPAKLAATAWLLLGVVVLAGFVVRAYLFQDMSRWPFERMRPKLTEYAEREKTGEVVWDRHETARKPPVTITDHLVIAADRFVRFFQFTSSGFSRMHNLISVAYYVPLYLLGLLGSVIGLRGGDPKRRAVVQAALVWIAGTALVHAVTILDYDWRYRLPVVPQLILLAACGAEILLRGMQRAPLSAAAHQP